MLRKVMNHPLKWIGILLGVLVAGMTGYQLFVGFVLFQWTRTRERDVSPTNLFRSVNFPLTNMLGHRMQSGAMGDSEEWHLFEAGKDARERLNRQRQLEPISRDQVPKRFWTSGPAWWKPGSKTNLVFYCCKCSWDYAGTAGGSSGFEVELLTVTKALTQVACSVPLL
jgi:hypothetical protein